jgi:predicted phage terminase large subunit-like protein
VLESFKLPNALGSDGYAGQHMQRPSPAGGGMFKVDAWRFWRFAEDPDVSKMRPKIEGVELSALPARVLSIDDLEEMLISVDATFKKTTKGSYVAIHVWGKLGSRRPLLDRVHARMDFTETVQALLSVIRRWPRARRKLIEGKANGDAIISTLEKEHGITGIEAVNPGTDSKVQRAHAGSSYQAAGNVELYDGAPYTVEYIGEHAAFPNGPHNDDVDAQAQGLQGLERERTTADKYNDIEWE